MEIREILSSAAQSFYSIYGWAGFLIGMVGTFMVSDLIREFVFKGPHSKVDLFGTAVFSGVIGTIAADIAADNLPKVVEKIIHLS